MAWLKGTTFIGVLSALFVGVFPFVTSEHLFYATLNGKYFFLLTFVSALALIFSYKIYNNSYSASFRQRWLLFATVVALVVSGVAGVVGVFPERSFFSEILRSTGLVYLAYIGALGFFLSEMLNVRDWVLVRRSISISAAIFSFLTLLGAQGFDLHGKFLTVNLEDTGITLGSETFAGAYLLIAFAVTLVEFFRSKSTREYVLFGGLLVVQVLSPLLFNTVALLYDPLGSLSNPLTLVGSARSSSVAVVLLLGYLLGVLFIRRWGSFRLKTYLYSGWASVFLVGVSVLLILLFTSGSSVQERYIQESSAARIIVWEAGVQAFKDRPILGWGPENFQFAFNQNFDNRLYLNENIGEIWFDRAHNIFIDTLVSVGVAGAATYALLIIISVAVLVRATRSGLISLLEAHVLVALIVAHILQLQTAFDTVGTYGLLAFVLGYLLWLERGVDVSVTRPVLYRRLVAGGIVLLVVVASVPFLFGEYRQQKALYKIFVTVDSMQQEVYIHQALAQESDFETFRLAYASLVKGLFSHIAEKKVDQKKLGEAMRQLAIYEEFMRTYIERHPEDYRTRLNFAYLLLTTTALGGDDHIAEAKEVIAGSYKLSPENPLTYVLAATAEMYGGNIVGAREKIAEGIALNPDIEFTQDMAQYIEKQAAQFPNITVLKLENL